MNDILKKLNYTNEPNVLILNAPDDLEPLLEAFRTSSTVDTIARKNVQYGFVLGFATTLAQVQRVAGLLETSLEPGDAKVWMCYPKGSSKRYACEFNRDTGWASFGSAGFEPVRQVAVDQDWSALRFRRAEFIKSMTRDSSMALSALGKARTSKKTRT
jgi:hypothetical protein